MKAPLGTHDIAFVAAVSAQAMILAHLREPRWKAAILSLPIPFTMASLAVGRPVEATHVLALALLFLFMQAVRILHQRWRAPVILAIVLSAVGYILVGSLLAPVIPDSDAAFWVSLAGILGLGVWLLTQMPRRSEPGHRSPLPIWLKLPILAGIILILVLLKNLLQGFMALFPIMSAVGAYESRHSLWTLGRQMPVVMVTLAPMMAACRLTQRQIGLGPALIVGWLVFLVVFLSFTWTDWKGAPPVATDAGGD